MGDASDIERRKKEKERGNRLCNIVKKAKKELSKTRLNCVVQVIFIWLIKNKKTNGNGT